MVKTRVMYSSKLKGNSNVNNREDIWRNKGEKLFLPILCFEHVNAVRSLIHNDMQLLSLPPLQQFIPSFQDISKKVMF